MGRSACNILDMRSICELVCLHITCAELMNNRVCSSWIRRIRTFRSCLTDNSVCVINMSECVFEEVCLCANYTLHVDDIVWRNLYEWIPIMEDSALNILTNTRGVVLLHRETISLISLFGGRTINRHTVKQFTG